MNIGSLDDLLQALIVTGAVSNLVEWESETRQKNPDVSIIVMAEFGMEGFRGLSQEQALAAATLAAAAFNSSDPYADPEWLAVAGGLRDDPTVSQRAASLLRNLGYEPWGIRPA